MAQEAADWTAQPVSALMAPVASRNRLLSIAQAGSRAIAVGQQGVILVSDEGKTWRQVASPVSQMLTRVRFADERNGWITGHDAVILATRDGGETWTVQHLDANSRPLYDLQFVDADRGIAVGGYGTLLSTVDGGKSWTTLASPLADLGLHFNRLVKVQDGSLLVAGEKGLLARSTDGGANWRLLKSPYAGSYFGLLPLGGNKVLAYGMRGNVFVTEDIRACPVHDVTSWDPHAENTRILANNIAALGWRQLASPSKESLFGALRQANGEALLVGINGSALVTELAASRLHAVPIPAEETLVDMLNIGSRLIAVGKRGVQDLGEAR